MFKKTSATQIDMFRDMSTHMSDRKTSILNDPHSWHNVFLREVTQRVDESVFAPLFNQGGRPNSPLRVLLGMMVLKEGNGWSDEQLFDNCRFNIRCMKALGLCHIDDDIPVESTYYEFRRRLGEYNENHGQDLIGESFRSTTRDQISSYNIKGERIRMDSKLIQSNIAKAGRLELVLETVRVSITPLELSLLSGVVQQEDLSLLESLKATTVSNITYPLDSGQKQELLTRMGPIIKQLLAYCDDQAPLHRIYREHYREVSDKDGDDQGPQPPGRKIQVRDARQVSPESMQSVHDPQAAYRRKGHGNSEQKVSGYHANITETCSEGNPFNLVTDVQVVEAHICEDTFLLPAIDGSNEVLQGQNPVKHVTTDGGYDSRANRQAMAKEDTPHWNMSRHKGTQLRYQLSRDRQGNLWAYCKKREETCRVTFSQRVAKHVIHHGDGTKRYMTQQEMENYLMLQAHYTAQDSSQNNIRPNVEATIHQVFHRLLKRDRIKYRGKYQCTLYVFSRAYWTNFRRICKNQVQTALDLLFSLFYPWEDQLRNQKQPFLI